jgi:hypothetical protein
MVSLKKLFKKSMVNFDQLKKQSPKFSTQSPISQQKTSKTIEQITRLQKKQAKKKTQITKEKIF